MKILIVEDNQFKVDKLGSFLDEEFGYTDVVTRTSYSSALNEIIDNPVFDLILLDISIPSFDVMDSSGPFMPSGGKHLFSQIYLNNIESKVVVVTLYKRFDDGSAI